MDYRQLYYQTLPRRRKKRDQNVYGPDTVEDKIDRLESDKESLILQVGVLTDQVEAQGDKIQELESNLDEKHTTLMTTQDILENPWDYYENEQQDENLFTVPPCCTSHLPSQELLSRTSLETHKLDLMAEISSLKIKLATSEKDKRILNEKLQAAQHHISDLEMKLNLRDAEIAELKHRLARNGIVPSSDAAETEVEKLKKAVDSLMVSNEDKDKRIDDLRRNLRRYKRVEEMVVQAQGRKALDDLLTLDDDTSSTSSTTPSVNNDTVKDHGQNGYAGMPEERFSQKHGMPTPTATSTPVNYTDIQQTRKPLQNNGGSPPSTIHGSTPKRPPVRSNSLEDITPAPPKTPPNSKRHNIQAGYGTLPKDRHVKDHEDRDKKSGNRGFPTLGKTFLRIKSGKRSCSAPNLGEVSSEESDDVHHRYAGLANGGTVPYETKKKKGIRRFFGKLKRSSSQDFDGERPEDFKRGGIRATAGPRLGWSKDIKPGTDDLNIPFARWDTDRVMSWMHDIGLNMYVVDCRRWVKNGEQLLRATPHDLEKELSLKNPLHRKKLQLALQAAGTSSLDKFGEIDHNWVTKWLDDIGLPQYKDHFYDGRVDGRMLHYCTVDDLLSLKVTNELHHTSIKRGIQILRLNNFNPTCLRRRPLPEEGDVHGKPQYVSLWTNHRVMEWLRTIDLSEYAPNLRGSGVHGALMILEPRFNAELFAQILSIPSAKTLLRRHLTTHFVALIGHETQMRKREYENSSGFVPLAINAKVKHKKFGLFHHKRSKSDSECDGFICPMDLSNGGKSNGTTKKPLTKEEKERAEKAAKEIGAVSKEIHSLTTMLTGDTFENVQVSNV